MAQYSPGQLDVLARQRGFPDYATWVAWNQHRQNAMGNGGRMGAAMQPQQPAPNNWLQTLLGQIPGTPTHVLGYVRNKYRQATGH